MHDFHRRRLATLFIALLLAAQLRAKTEPEDFFERRIRPLLVENCVECHREAPDHRKGGLALDSASGWKQGGERGPVIVPGDATKSLLFEAVRYALPDVQMPPRGKLQDAQIKDLETWITMGAPDPREKAPDTTNRPTGSDSPRATHWAFQRITDPPLPSLADGANSAWIRDPLDRFVVAALTGNRLDPAKECDRRTWLRRVTFDLIGLPPTESELVQFDSDRSDDAYEKVVDRLLASPHYGERWGRLWLDVARYADSNGSDENLAIAEAWRYRDYVVNALNDDLPYDRFVTEQIAGDLLPEPECDSPDAHADIPQSKADKEATRRILRRQKIATGFLCLGPKMLAEPDREKLDADTIDEQIDVITKGILGVSFTCARCHDHKFDPFTQKDYYALAGILKSTSTFEAPQALSRWREIELGTKDEIAVRDAWRKEHDAANDAVMKALDHAKNVRRAELLRQLPRYLAAVRRYAQDAVLIEAEDYQDSTLHVDHETHGNADVGVVYTNRDGTSFAEYDLDLCDAQRFAIEIRYACGDARPIRVLVDGTLAGENVLKDATGGFGVDSRKWAPAGSFEAAAGRHRIRLERDSKGSQYFPHLDTLLIHPVFSESSAWPPDSDAFDPDLDRSILRSCAEWLARRPDETVVARAPELANALCELKDPKGAIPGKDGGKDAALESVRKSLTGWLSPIPDPALGDESRFAADDIAVLAKLRTELAAVDARKPPELDHCIGVSDDKVVELPVFVRGNHRDKQKDVVPRATPAVFDSLDKLPPIEAGASGRLELASWLTSETNPLTARVIVNRVWQGHFGRGLVATASNFGVRGEKPTHPELLDHLATYFIANHFSLKALHRKIVLSGTYRMSGGATAAALERDPDDRLLSRFPRRRLEAEELRDAMLATSGTLDLTMGGSLLTTKDREYVGGDSSGSDKAQFGGLRRTLYLPVLRNIRFEFLTTFDVPDAATSADGRNESTVATQSLWLLNSPFAIEQGEALAKRIEADSKESPNDDAARIDRAYRRVYLRAPTASETERAVAFLADAKSSLKDSKDRDHDALVGLCQALLSSSEFLYVD